MQISVYLIVGLLVFTSIVISNTSLGQSLNFLQWQNPKFPIPDYREDNRGNRTSTSPLVDSRALLAFTGMYNGASDIRWFELDNKFLVKFKKDGRETTALFNRKGVHIYSISYGSEKHLPSATSILIRSTYLDYRIKLVVEVNTLGTTAWITKLENEKQMIIVKVVDGEMEEIENYFKSK